MRNGSFWWFFVGFWLLVDLYFFQALKAVSQSASGRTRTILFTGYWTLSIIALAVLILLPYIQFERQARLMRSTLFALVAGLFFAKIIACFFFLLDDIRRGSQWLAARVGAIRPAAEKVSSGEGISRSLFLSWAGMLVGTGLYGTLLYGFGNKYRYQVRRQRLAFPGLPASFRGLRIVQLSDIHSGSFNDKKAVERGVQKVLDLKPDLILFTGDLVNNVADEMEEYQDIFARLQAPLGVYSILGNHDYGDYVGWPDAGAKAANLEKLKTIQRNMGWRLLLNEHVALERGGEKIALLGVENWSSKARFPRYGSLEKAYEGTEQYPVKILMSHDPSHWKAEVCEKYPDINLMLSGHTHGMQFGVEIPGLRWSPVQYVYREWAGLYEREDHPSGGRQALYVNRGFGFIGYPGRVGILPEITLLELV